MKKQLIATIVGGAILFVWQFLSWAAIPIHQNEYGYTPNQDKILECLAQNLSEEGTYMLPMSPPGSSHEQQSADMEKNMGKPWASISYHRSFDASMGLNMFRGFVIDLVIAWLLVWLLSKFENLSLRSALQTSLAVGFIAYLAIPYLHSIWFDENTFAHLIDAVAMWGLVGLWMGWWLTRR